MPECMWPRCEGDRQAEDVWLCRIHWAMLPLRDKKAIYLQRGKSASAIIQEAAG